MHILGYFFITYGYILAFPIMVVEGPLSTMIMSALAAAGYFNIVIIFFLSLIADMISDYMFYLIGRKGARGAIVRLSKIFRYDPDRITTVQGLFQRHGGFAVFMAKLLPGLVPPVFIAAGMSKYPRKKLFLYALPAGAIWSMILCMIGYYFGRHITSVERLLSRTGIILSVVVIFLILYQLFFGKVLSKRAFQHQDEKEGRQNEKRD